MIVKVGTRWGRSGVPSDVKDEGKKHQVKTVSLINTIEQARDAIANGYAGNKICDSNYGFSSKRNSVSHATRNAVDVTRSHERSARSHGMPRNVLVCSMDAH